MNAKRLAPFVLAAVVLGAGGYALYRLGVDQGMKVAGSVTSASSAATGAPQKAGDVDPSTGKRVLYWHDPMVPGPKFDKPGKSPFMDMQLVPVYADDAPDKAGVVIDPRVQQNLGVRTTKAVAGSLSSAISAVGNVAYNERDVVVVQARSNAFVEKLYVRA